MNFPPSVWEQVPVVLIFVTFTGFMLGLGVKVETSARREYLQAIKEERDQFLAGLERQNEVTKELAATVSAMHATLIRLDEAVKPAVQRLLQRRK